MSAIGNMGIALLLLTSAAVFAKERELTTAPTISFKENKGQLKDQHDQPRNDIRFYGSTQGLSYYLKSTGLSYQLYKQHGSSRAGSTDLPPKEPSQPDSVTIQRIDISWLGANPKAKIITTDPVAGVEHYYTSATPITDVKSYGAITYKNIYPSIDLKYYSKEGSLKYDYIVKPGADYHNIKLKIEGATSITKNKDGSITIHTPLGDIQEGEPVAYQEGKRKKMEWVLSNGVLSFDVGAYEKNKMLTIDPLVTQGYITFGSNGSPYFNDFAYSVCEDKNKNVFVTGSYGSYPGAFIATGVLIKYGSSGNLGYTVSIEASTGFGAPNDCTVDTFNNVYVCGTTNSSTNIATSGGFVNTWNGNAEAYLIKYDNNGVKLWGTYYGGTGTETLTKCATDGQGNVYACGTSTSSSGIASPGGFQTLLAGVSDAFVVKFDSSGARLWATYYGGGGNDAGLSCAAELDGGVFLCGNTNSVTGIATTGSHQPSYSGTGTNAFLVKLSAAGVPVWATYYGADGSSGENCAVDTAGNVYLAGNTTSLTDISSSVSHQPNLAGGTDGFLAKFNSSGTRAWATYLGGTGDETVAGCSADASGQVYVSGTTKSASGIATVGAVVDILHSTTSAFLMQYDSSGNKLWGGYKNPAYWSTGPSSPIIYLDNYGAKCYAGSAGDIYLAGNTGHHTPGMLNIIDRDGFVEKFSPYTVPVPSITALPSTAICSGDTVLLATLAITYALYQWYLNGIAIGGATSSVYKATTPGSYRVKVNSNSSIDSSQSMVLSLVPTVLTTVSKTDVLCYGDANGTISISASGATPPYTYAWNSLASTAPQVSNLNIGTYISTTTDANGCKKKDTIVISQPLPLTTSVSSSPVPCSGGTIGSITVGVTGGVPPYIYSWNNLSVQTPNVSNLPVGTYIATITDANNCIKMDTVTIVQDTVSMPSQPLASLCAVSVDSASGKNLVIWEKTGARHASRYNVYRETSTEGQYSLIGFNLSGQFSTYLDNTSVPLQQSYRYKISEKDSCGNEFAMSSYHKTIHLATNMGINGEINLAWNSYEGKTYSTHYIMRRINGGAFTNIAQVASSVTSYTDISAPFGNKTYRIDIDLPGQCNPTAKTTVIDRISSNTVTLFVPADKVKIVPNPTKGIITVIGEVPAKIKLTNALGQTVMEGSNQTSLSLYRLYNGVYMVTLYDETGAIYHREKIVKE